LIIIEYGMPRSLKDLDIVINGQPLPPGSFFTNIS
jgi:hypothetical protein